MLMGNSSHCVRTHSALSIPLNWNGSGNGRVVCVGYRLWKRKNVTPFLSLFSERVRFVPNVRIAERMKLSRNDCLVHWGCDVPRELEALSQHTGARLLRMEDGFVRSVGLGSNLVRPLSLVLDQRGIYFDPAQPSDLEYILNTVQFPAEELERARKVRAFIASYKITKYNIDPHGMAAWADRPEEVVLVPGQVEDDASILHGCQDVKTNLGLLQAVRQAHPRAFIVYKPHPDVMAGNRPGKLELAQAREYADHVELHHSVVSCIEACDVVHTMTSLTGFDALLRGKQVVTHGQPFYAGWGLTEDMAQGGIAFLRRKRRLTLDELVCGALLRYPVYWDWELKGYTTCEAVLQRIVEMRCKLEVCGGLENPGMGYVRQQTRKLGILARSGL